MRSTYFIASLSVVALAAVVAAMPVPAPCETTIDYGYKAAPINVLSNNGKNSGLISSGNDNGYHQGDGSTYQAGTNSTQASKATADNNQKSSGAVGGDAAPQVNKADGNDSQTQSQSQVQNVSREASTKTVYVTHTVTATQWLIPTISSGHSHSG